ncbi:ras-related protein RabZ-like [Eriocheir sinensis]|uniref:ras-related protein RabZ-like n=1 Tax=Eriocheir sinensis TaxID=95602 RepID=UPI0021C62107|nr:ras-related protein RabZ-like [Eriocheir sinensis]XP_050718067.1 ras-related protein RabZ-like [Eriocheir sinensis]XP_050718068.1 ras-related protein RabZ-like [Eriocheir sinensis]XP_050718069.1 ras-related protein RabZ-like [Eriocheir sinensis]
METIAEDSFYFPKEEDKEGNHNHKTSPSSSVARGEERGGVRGRGEKENETEMGQKTNDLSFPSRSAGDDDRGGGGGGGGGGPEKGEEEEGSEEEEERTEVDTEQDKDEKPDENKEENSSTTPGNSTTTSPITEEETPPQASSSTSSSKTVTPPTSLPLGNKRAMKPPAKNCFRLVVLGASRVGKTSIVSRFLNNKFEDSYTPTIEDFHRKLYRIRGDVYQLDILDTSGNHPFPAMRRLSFLTGDLFVLVFSWDSRESWDEILRLREQILETKQCASASLSGSRRRLRGGTNRVPMVIAGNKKDKEQR